MSKSLSINVPLDWIIAGMCYAQQPKMDNAKMMRARVQEWATHQDLLHSASLKGFGDSEYKSIPSGVLLNEFDRLFEEKSR